MQLYEHMHSNKKSSYQVCTLAMTAEAVSARHWIFLSLVNRWPGNILPRSNTPHDPIQTPPTVSRVPLCLPRSRQCLLDKTRVDIDRELETDNNFHWK